jgi:hypothetical protein
MNSVTPPVTFDETNRANAARVLPGKVHPRGLCPGVVRSFYPAARRGGQPRPREGVL